MKYSKEIQDLKNMSNDKLKILYDSLPVRELAKNLGVYPSHIQQEVSNRNLFQKPKILDDSKIKAFSLDENEYGKNSEWADSKERRFYLDSRVESVGNTGSKQYLRNTNLN